MCVGFLASDLGSNLDLTEFNNIDFWHFRLKDFLKINKFENNWYCEFFLSHPNSHIRVAE